MLWFERENLKGSGTTSQSPVVLLCMEAFLVICNFAPLLLNVSFSKDYWIYQYIFLHVVALQKPLKEKEKCVQIIKLILDNDI